MLFPYLIDLFYFLGSLRRTPDPVVIFQHFPIFPFLDFGPLDLPMKMGARRLLFQNQAFTLFHSMDTLPMVSLTELMLSK